MYTMKCVYIYHHIFLPSKISPFAYNMPLIQLHVLFIFNSPVWLVLPICTCVVWSHSFKHGKPVVSRHFLQTEWFLLPQQLSVANNYSIGVGSVIWGFWPAWSCAGKHSYHEFVGVRGMNFLSRRQNFITPLPILSS